MYDPFSAFPAHFHFLQNIPLTPSFSHAKFNNQAPFSFCWDDFGEELRSCIWRGKANLVRELLALGADPNYRTVYAGWRPLHYAAWNDRAGIALDLIAAGADKDAQVWYLFFQVANWILFVLTLRNASLQNDHGQTALHLAATRASTTCIPALLDVSGIVVYSGRANALLTALFSRLAAIPTSGMLKAVFLLKLHICKTLLIPLTFHLCDTTYRILATNLHQENDGL